MASVLTITATEIANMAMSIINEKTEGQDLDQIELTDTIDTLNSMIKMWQAQGLHLWTKQEGVLFLEQGKTDYLIGPNGDQTSSLDDFGITHLSQDAVAGSALIFLESILDATAADNLFVVDPATDAALWTVNSGTLIDTGGFLTLTGGVATACNISLDVSGLTIGSSYTLKTDGLVNTTTTQTLFILSDTNGGGASMNVSGSTGRTTYIARDTVATITIQTDPSGALSCEVHELELFDNSTGTTMLIKLNSGGTQSATAIGIDGLEVDISIALSSDSDEGNSVTFSGNNIDRPISILDLRRSTIDSEQDIPAFQWSSQEYFAQPNKLSQGTVNNWYYLPQLTDGRLWVWQTASSDDQIVKFTYIRPLEVTTTETEVPDFPSEWFLPLAYNLAFLIGPEYRQPQGRLDEIELLASEYLEDALAYDREKSSLNIQPFQGF